jgi:hypothetical protein
MDKVIFELPIQDGADVVLKQFEADTINSLSGFMPEADGIDEVLVTETESPWGGDGPMESGRTHREFVVATASGVPQAKIEMERQCTGPRWARICVNVPVAYKRTAKYSLNVRLSTGKVTNDDIWIAIKNCVLSAAAVAGASAAVAGYASGGSASLAVVKATFVPTLKTCLSAKSAEIAAIATDAQVDFKLDSESGPWRRAS